MALEKIHIIVIFIIAVFLAFYYFFNLGIILNKAIFKPDYYCEINSDCKFKSTACPETCDFSSACVNENWLQFCPFPYRHDFCVDGFLPHKPVCKCVNNRCETNFISFDEYYCENANPESCTIDEDCICNGQGCFLGNKNYYEKCVKTKESEMLKVCMDFCGFGPYEWVIKTICENNICKLATFDRTTGERIK